MSAVAGQETETQVCGGCERLLPLSSFAPTARRPGAYCRDCRKHYQRNYMREARGARREVEELRERIGSLEKIVASLVRRVA